MMKNSSATNDVKNSAAGGPIRWLIGGGLVMAALAAILGFIDVIGDARLRSLSHVWWHMGGNVLAVVVELGNIWLRGAQGVEASIAPTGVILSLITTAILLFTGWMGGEMVYRDHVGAIDGEAERVRVRSR